MQKNFMIWKYNKKIKKQQNKDTFIPQHLEESRVYMKNPFRGWYTLYTFAIEDVIDTEQLIWCLNAEESIALVQVDIGAYADRLLDDAALHHLAGILQFFQAQEKDVILRPVYDREGNGIEREPDTLEMVLHHLEQIGQVLQEIEHSVFLFQGLLIGSWGEMHTSKYLEPEMLRRLYQCIAPYLTEEIALAVRTPALWRTLVPAEEYETGTFPHIGLFHDALFASESDLGTYGTMTKEAAGWQGKWMRQQEVRFAESLCAQVAFGGETLAAKENTISFSQMLKEMKQLQLTYLNHAYDPKVLQRWKETSYEKEFSYYDHIGLSMGYRYVVRDPQMIKRSLYTRTTELSFEIENMGFGRCMQEIRMWIMIISKEKSHRIDIAEDLSQWKSGEKRQVCVKIDNTLKGNVYLQACLKKDGRMIRFSNKNSELLLLGVLNE